MWVASMGLTFCVARPKISYKICCNKWCCNFSCDDNRNGKIMKKNEILLKKPTKNPDPKISSKNDGDVVVITYPKDFGSIEKWFHDRIGGPEIIKRPLDKYTTLIWELCNGKNSVKDIVDIFDSRFGEEVAPAASRVQIFLEKLLELNLIILE
ncbi:MAG: hypothetical protein CXT75_01545 [Methanobacteriota archaeon]|nr:MAG: hypothetical protein CXT75_01545 [Euryarchaeota archaeon]